MDFAWSAEEEAFRGEIREFLQAERPEGWSITQFWDPDDDAQFAFAHEFTKKRGRKNWHGALSVLLAGDAAETRGRSTPHCPSPCPPRNLCLVLGLTTPWA